MNASFDFVRKLELGGDTYHVYAHSRKFMITAKRLLTDRKYLDKEFLLKKLSEIGTVSLKAGGWQSVRRRGEARRDGKEWACDRRPRKIGRKKMFELSSLPSKENPSFIFERTARQTGERKKGRRECRKKNVFQIHSLSLTFASILQSRQSTELGCPPSFLSSHLSINKFALSPLNTLSYTRLCFSLLFSSFKFLAKS